MVQFLRLGILHCPGGTGRMKKKMEGVEWLISVGVKVTFYYPVSLVSLPFFFILILLFINYVPLLLTASSLPLSSAFPLS